LRSLRELATTRIRAWSARRHGADALPVKIERRRIYILPTRFGLMLTALLVAMLVAGLNYSSNLGLAFAFFMVSTVLVAMHHCHRNLLGLTVDVKAEVDAFAGSDAAFYFMLRNESAVDRCDVEVRLGTAADSPRVIVQATRSVAIGSYEEVMLAAPVANRGVSRWSQFELRTAYPFGWFRAWTYVHAPLTAYVAPSPRGNRPLPAAPAVAGDSARSDSRGEEDFAGLRSYAPGIPLKHMAWKTLARGGEAAVRVYSDPGARPEWLEWSALDGLDTETRLSQLCRWITASETGHPRPYGLRMPAIDIPPGRGPAHRSRCLRALACHGMPRP
jgi:uncharacterized protein (DUF58 family)